MREYIATREGHSSTIAGLARFLVVEGARSWQLPPRLMSAMVALPFVIAVSGVVFALAGKSAYKWFTAEDALAETLQVILYCVALVMTLIFTWRQHRAGEGVITLLYAGLAVAFFFMIGEEISWGQRLIGWATPQALAEINKQQETTLHNIRVIDFVFKWVQLLVGAYGTVLPLVLLLRDPSRKWQKLLDVVVPHYTLVLYFLPMFVWRLFRNTIDIPDGYYFVVSEYNEVIELILAIGFVLFVAFQLRKLKAPAVGSDGQDGIVEM